MKRFVIFFGITTFGAVAGLIASVYEILFVKGISDQAFMLFIMTFGYAVVNLIAFNWAITEYEKEINVSSENN